ncbi:MAG: Uma2 family endonuclease [Myxococcota bacterium]
MSSQAPKRATYEDLLSVPEHMIGEIIDGVLYTQPRPASPHAFATSGLLSDLVGPFQRGRGGPGGWVILFEPELHMGTEVLVPDLAGWRRERMPRVPNTPFFELAPDWICEALSASTARRDRTIKLDVYRRAGVAFVWLLDPIDRTLEVLALDGETYRIAATFLGEVEARAHPFDAVALDLALLWLPPESGSEAPGA